MGNLRRSSFGHCLVVGSKVSPRADLDPTACPALSLQCNGENPGEAQRKDTTLPWDPEPGIEKKSEVLLMIVELVTETGLSGREQSPDGQ